MYFDEDDIWPDYPHKDEGYYEDLEEREEDRRLREEEE